MESGLERTPGKIRIILFAVCLSPLAWLIAAGHSHHLDPDPAEAVIQATGDWALSFVLLSLAIAAVRTFAERPSLAPAARLVLWFAIFYAGLHLLAYLWFDQSFDGREILLDLARHPFLAAGFLSLALLLCVGLAATTSLRRGLGERHCKRLQRLAYLAALIGVVHYFWAVKQDIAAPAASAVVLIALFYAGTARARRIRPAPLQPVRTVASVPFPPAQTIPQAPQPKARPPMHSRAAHPRHKHGGRRRHHPR